PDRRANGVEFGIEIDLLGDTLIAVTGDPLPDRLLHLGLVVHAGSSVEPAIDAQPAFGRGQVLDFILGQAVPSLLIVFKLSHRPGSSSLRWSATTGTRSSRPIRIVGISPRRAAS